MMLAFAHPALFWTGAGLIAVPILIHLFFRRRHRVVRWAAMEFLLAALKKQKRRIEMENLLILLLRCAGILLMAAAIARPTARAAVLAPFTGGARNLVLVVDTSASMGARHTGLRAVERARDRAAALLGRLPESSNITLVATCDDNAAGAPRCPIENARPADVRARLAGLRPSHGPNRPAEVFRLVREKLDQMPGRSQIVYLTDLQRRDWRDENGERREELYRALRSLRGESAEEGPPITILDVGAEEVANVAIAEFSKEEGRELFSGTLCGLQARLVNFAPTPAEGTLSLFMARDDGSFEKKNAVPVRLRPSLQDGPPASETVPLFLPLPPGFSGAARFRVAYEPGSAGGDRLPEDSERCLAARIRPPVRFLPVQTYAGAIDIFRDIEGLEVIDFAEPILPQDLGRADLRRIDVILWADPEPRVDPEAIARIEGFVRRGGGFLAYLGTNAQPSVVNGLFYKERGEGLFPMLLADVPPVKLEGEATPAHIEMREPVEHPLFREMTASPQARAFFQSPEYLYFRPVRDPLPGSVVARYDTTSHDPAVLEHRLGRGRVLVATSTPDERGFRLNGSLLPAAFFFEAAHYLVAEDASARNILCGGTLRIPLPGGARLVIVEPPEEAGGRTEWPVESADVPFQMASVPAPGFYRFTIRLATPPGSAEPPPDEVQIAAVNVDPAEGDLRRIPRDELLRAYSNLPLKVAASDEEALPVAAAAAQGEWSRVLLAAVAGVLLLELFLAWRFNVRRRSL